MGSTAPLKILAGLNLVCKSLGFRRINIVDNDLKRTISALDSGIVEGTGLAPFVVAVGGAMSSRVE